MATISPRDRFLATYRRYQPWSIPESIIYYMAKNPSSPECYEKLIQACKYFFFKNPILIVSNLLQNYSDNNEWQTWADGEDFDLKNISSKIWVTSRLCAYNFNQKAQNGYYAAIIPKIYRSDIKEFSLWKQSISFNNFIFLASKSESIWLNNVTIMNDDGNPVVFEKLFECLPNVKDFTCYFANASKMITSTTVKELIKIPHICNLESLSLTRIPENFDISTFYDYIKKNKTTKIQLLYNDISNEYKALLQKIINEILAAENRSFKVPLINFDGIDETVYNRLFHLYDELDEL